MKVRTTTSLLILFWLSGISLFAQSTVLDFSTERRLEILHESGLESVDFGASSRIGLPAGSYEILLSSDNVFKLEVVGGYITPEFNDDSNVSKLVFRTRALTMLEAMALADAFHEAFDLPKKGLSEWVEPFNQGGVFSGSYSIGSDENYPAMGMKLLSAYSRETPIIIQYTYTWHSMLMKRRGVSPETNTVNQLSYNMPEILASLQHEPVVLGVSTGPIVEVVVEEVAASEQVVAEPMEEPVEERSNWWLWLIGLLVVVGGVFAVRSRK